MKKNTELVAINTILAVIFVVLVFVVMLIISAINFRQGMTDDVSEDMLEVFEENEEDVDWSDEFMLSFFPQLILAEKPSVQLIGNNYQGVEAKEGYQYYAVKVYVTNVGAYAQKVEYAPIYCKGNNYEDVYTEYTMEDENAFSYTNMAMIPSGKTSPVEIVVQVKDGIKEFDVQIGNDLNMGWIPQSETVHLE